MDIESLSQRLIESAKGTMLRFPLTIAFLAILSIQLVYLVLAKVSPNALTYFLAVGMLVSLLYHVCEEDIPEEKKEKANTVLYIALIALAGDSILLYGIDKISIAMVIAQSAAIVALVVAVCFLPFYKEKNDRKSWNFVFNILFSGAISYAVGLIMMLSLFFLYAGSCELFGVKMENNVFGVLAVLCLITIPVLLFLIRIPEGEQKHNDMLPKNRLVLGISRYLFLPLALLYMAVLYVYGAKILFTWTLPKGMLGGMVSAFMFGIVSLTFLLYPYINDLRHNGLEKRVMRYLLPAVLPLLVLMSIGLCRRLIDYGITAPRLYVLTLNVWFYVVVIGLWLNKARRIHWISISFAFILIATSCHPLNYTNIARWCILGRFNKALAANPIENNINNASDLRKYFLSLPEDIAREQYRAFQDCSDLDYTYYTEKLGDDAPHLYLDYDDFMNIKTETAKKEVLNSLEMNYNYNSSITVPEGYKSMVDIHIKQSIVSKPDEARKDIADFVYDLNENTFKLSIANHGIMEIQHADLYHSKEYAYTTEDKQAILVIKSLKLMKEYDDGYRCYLDGYLFFKQ